MAHKILKNSSLTRPPTIHPFLNFRKDMLFKNCSIERVNTYDLFRAVQSLENKEEWYILGVPSHKINVSDERLMFDMASSKFKQLNPEIFPPGQFGGEEVLILKLGNSLSIWTNPSTSKQTLPVHPKSKPGTYSKYCSNQTE